MSTNKKFVYFLGAGASFAAGATAKIQARGTLPIPTQATFWDTFLRFSASPVRRREIESFLFRYFRGYSKVPSRVKASARRELLGDIDVEEVFTFLSERIAAPSTSPQLRKYANSVWSVLVTEIGNVFSRFSPNKRTRSVYRTLLRNHIRRFDAVVSFNYNTVFEKSLPTSEAWVYEGVSSTTNALPILKPHGSVNWILDDNGNIGIDGHGERSVVVAPSHLKFVASRFAPDEGGQGYLDQSQTIQGVWTRMEKEMRAARALIFVGYSFPVADLYFSSVLRSVLADRGTAPTIVIVNPDAVSIAQRISTRFSLSKVIRYFDMSQFIQVERTDVIRQIEA